MDLPEPMAVFNENLARALDSSIGQKNCVYLGPRLSRKRFSLMAEKCGGYTQRSAVPPPPENRRFEREWQELWQNLTVSGLQSLHPDSGGYLACFPAEYSAERLSQECGGVPLMMVSCWTCLLHNVLESEGPAAYLFVKEAGRSMRLHSASCCGYMVIQGLRAREF